MNLSETPLILLLFSAAIVSLYGYGAIIVRYIFPQWSSYPGLIMLFGLLLFLAVSGYIELFHLGAPQAFHWMIALGNNMISKVLVFINSLGIKISRGLFSYQIFMVSKILPSLAYLLSHSMEQSKIRSLKSHHDKQ